MAAERQKIKFEDLKAHFVNAMDIHSDDQGDGAVFVYGKTVDPEQIPSIIIDELKKLGFLNSLKIDMK